ncbi:hypothetical protein [Streptomyces sp. NPDC057418]|uniref:hypothetical protein n=1 Tax=Streptomyces sp. NPDC057418 TaxID=3346126 RepID=UPI0036856933
MAAARDLVPRTGAVAPYSLLPSPELRTLRGANRHGLHGEHGDPCVDGAVGTHLATGEQPTKDRTCADQTGRRNCRGRTSRLWESPGAQVPPT